MNKTPDKDIVAAVLAGQHDAFAVLVERYERRIFYALRWMAGSPSEAEELTQAAFCRAYMALATFNPEFRFSTWLFQIAYNLCRTAAKKQAHAVSLEEQFSDEDESSAAEDRLLIDPGKSPELMAEEANSSALIWSAVAALPASYREVVIMRHIEELSYLEICDLTGLPMGTVKSRLARARRELAAALAELVD